MSKLIRYLLVTAALYGPFVYAADPVTVNQSDRKTMYGAAAVRPTPDAFDLASRGMCYVATDTGTVTEWTGTAWITTATCPGSATAGGGTQYTEGDTDASITGTVGMWEDAGNTIVSTSASKPLPVEIIAGAGSGGTAIADDGDFTAGTTSMTPAGGFYQSSPTACTDGDTCAIGINSDRSVKVNDNGGSLTVDGTVTANLSATDNAVLDDIADGITVDLGVNNDVTLTQALTTNLGAVAIETPNGDSAMDDTSDALKTIAIETASETNSADVDQTGTKDLMNGGVDLAGASYCTVTIFNTDTAANATLDELDIYLLSNNETVATSYPMYDETQFSSAPGDLEVAVSGTPGGARDAVPDTTLDEADSWKLKIKVAGYATLDIYASASADNAVVNTDWTCN